MVGFNQKIRRISRRLGYRGEREALYNVKIEVVDDFNA
jgi:hypothetical protein